MTLLESNLARLGNRAPELASLLKAAAPPEELKIETARNGAPTARYGAHYLHSRHDPQREARRIAERLTTAQGDGFVVYGIGLGYLAEAVLQATEGEPVIVVERDPRMLAAASAHRDLRALFSADVFHLLVAPSPTEFAGFLSNLRLRRPVSVGLRSVTEDEQEYYEGLEEARRGFVGRQEVNRNTLRRFGRRWVRNLAANVHLLAEARGVADLQAKVPGLPALVCAGGPSLDAVLPHAQRLRERCLVVAVDTAVKPLLRAGVEPDFVVVVDPQYWNTRHLDNLTLKHAFVVGESSTHPRAFRALGRPVYLCSSIFPLGQYLEASRGSFGKLGAGGSVTTTAWDFARYIGADPIFIGGMDLGYPDYRTHVTGSLFEERSHIIATRLSPAETQQVAYIEGGQPYRTEANDGGSVLTDRRMAIYRDWFALQQNRSPRSYNLSSAGVRIPDIPPRDVADMLELPERRHEIDRLLAGALREARGSGETGSGGASPGSASADDAIRGATRRLAADLATARDLAREAGTAARHYRAGITQDHAEPGLDSPRRLDEIEGDLRSLASKDVIGFLLEAVTSEIEESRPETMEQALENSARLYDAILESAEFHVAMLERAEEVLDSQGHGE